MSLTKTHFTVAGLVAALGIPFALAQTGAAGQQPTQGGAPLAFVRTASSISADDHYLYVLSNGQISRVDKATGTVAGDLTPSGWSGQAPAQSGGGTTQATSGGGGQATAGAGGKATAGN